MRGLVKAESHDGHQGSIETKGHHREISGNLFKGNSQEREKNRMCTSNITGCHREMEGKNGGGGLLRRDGF